MAKSTLKQNKKVSKSQKPASLMNFIIVSILTAFFFALTFFLRKQAGEFIPIQTAYFIETSMQMTLMTTAFFLLSPEVKHGFDLNNIKGYMFAGLAGITIVGGVGLSYLALRMGALSTYQSITAPSQIIFAILLGTLLLREPLTIKQIVGTAVAVAGVLIIIVK
jgi:uncharacterized membrane protein